MKAKFLVSVLVLYASFAYCAKIVDKPDLPNIVIVFADDLGYGDLGSFGAIGFETPNLDWMAGHGMRFTNYYSGSGVCSPSRAALLTGCYPTRVGITKVLFPFDSIGLHSDEITIAEVLKSRGYATAAVGKWHLGHHRRFLPLQHGFDEYYGLPYSNDMWATHYDGTPVTADNMVKQWKLNAPPLFIVDGNTAVEEVVTLEDQSMLTTKYTERAVDFIGRNRDTPFFLYVAHSMPHVPIGVSSKFAGKSDAGLWGDVIMELDWSVGEIVNALREAGIEDNTLVIFTSDNGPWLSYGNHAGSAGGLREAKGTPFEGGFRVPCIMRWPGVLDEGSVCSQMASSIDLLPTIAEIVDFPIANKIDGVSLMPLLNGSFSSPPRREYFYFSGRSLGAVRIDHWKLVFPFSYSTNVGAEFGADGWPGKLPRTDFEGGLFDLRRDPGEQYNVKSTYPKIVEKLENAAESMRSALGDHRNEISGRENRAPGNMD